MPIVSVEQVTQGMVLAGPVVDRRGRLLIPAGKSLTDRHVGALKMWGIPHVEIEGEGGEDDNPSPVEPHLLEQARAELEPFFARTNGEHPFIGLLFDYCTLRRARARQKEHQEAGANVA